MSFISRVTQFGQKQAFFLVIISTLFIIAALVYPYPGLAMWFGFTVAAFSAVSNDSIQTIGTFIASNSNRPWYALWLFIGTLFLITVIFSWIRYDGDVTTGRLLTETASGELAFPQPDQFNYLQVAAPIFLLIITRLKMPVSTTFLLLSSFAITPGAVTSVIGKSITAYIIAFVSGFVVWLLITRLTRKYFKGEPRLIWVVMQWITSGTLWSVWIMQDAANIAIFLPRRLGIIQLMVFCGVIFAGLGLIFFLKGDRIQEIVNEKNGVRDIRSATLIDFVYACILIYKLFISTIPMSTTWVFIGLLGGRELGIRVFERITGDFGEKGIRNALYLLFKDLGLAFIGLVISILIAAGVNPEFKSEIFKLF